jgi:hypothetical protein
MSLLELLGLLLSSFDLGLGFLVYMRFLVFADLH